MPVYLTGEQRAVLIAAWVLFGVVYLLCLFHFLERTGEKRERGTISYVLSGTGIVGITAASYYSLALWLYWPGIFLGTFAAAGWLYRGNGRFFIRLFLYSIVMHGAEMMLLVLTNTVLLDILTEMMQDIVMLQIIYAILTMLAFWGITCFMEKIFAREERGTMTPMQYVIFSFLPVASVFYLISLTICSDMFVLRFGPWLLIGNYLLIFVMNLFVAYLFKEQEKRREEELELQLYRQQEILRFRQYEELEEKYQASRKVIHDVKNHIQMLERLYEAGENREAGRYIQDMNGMLRTLERVVYTDQKILNIILNEKLNVEELKGVKLKIKIGMIDLGFMRNIDVTTIFTNLLDNGKEALKEVQKDRVLELKVEEVRDFLVIAMGNTYSQNRKKENHSGLGLKNIENAIKRYQGTMQTKKEPDWFQITVLIPLDGRRMEQEEKT